MDGIIAIKEIINKSAYDPIRIVMVITSTIESERAECMQLEA